MNIVLGPQFDPFGIPSGTIVGVGVIPSPSGTIISVSTGGSITDASGNVWSFGNIVPATASVAVNGDVETSTRGITEMAYVNGEIWIYNTQGKWQGKKTPVAPWLPTAGTTVSPL